MEENIKMLSTKRSLIIYVTPLAERGVIGGCKKGVFKNFDGNFVKCRVKKIFKDEMAKMMEYLF